MREPPPPWVDHGAGGAQTVGNAQKTLDTMGHLKISSEADWFDCNGEGVTPWRVTWKLQKANVNLSRGLA